MAAWDPDGPKCGQPTRSGKPCQAMADNCRHHGPKSAPAGNATERPRASSGASRPDTARNMDQAAVMEAQGTPTADIATLLGVDAATVRGWRQRPEYRAAVRALRDELYAVGYSLALADRADNVGDLISIRSDPMVEPQHRIRAAAVLDGIVQKGHDAHVVQAELDDLKAEVAKLLDTQDGEAW